MQQGDFFAEPFMTLLYVWHNPEYVNITMKLMSTSIYIIIIVYQYHMSVSYVWHYHKYVNITIQYMSISYVDSKGNSPLFYMNVAPFSHPFFRWKFFFMVKSHLFLKMNFLQEFRPFFLTTFMNEYLPLCEI